MTATAQRDTTIRLSNVTIAYERHAAVHHLQGSFAPGSLTAIAGPNGAGKSTLLKALMGELPLAAGTIDRGGLAIRDFGYLPQAAEIDRSFPLSVADTVLLGAWHETDRSARCRPRRLIRRAAPWRRSGLKDSSAVASALYPPGNFSASSSRGF